MRNPLKFAGVPQTPEPLRLGEEKKEERKIEEETAGQKYNGLPYSIGRPL